MRKLYQTSMLAVIVLLSLRDSGFAQKGPEPERTLVKIEVVLSRYEGNRKISSLPFTMLAAAGGDNVSLRTGTRVPIPSGPTTVVGSDGKPVVNYNYQDFGTNIDCTVTPTEGNRFKVRVSIQDSSIVERQDSQTSGARGGTPIANAPIYRNFNYTNSALLKDGETKQFIAASDRVTGETVKVDVSLNLDK
jgi:hypothetical protein